MWEAQAAEDRLDELIDWVWQRAVPFLHDQPQCRGTAVYVSDDDRAVIIARFDGAPVSLPDAPTTAVRRPPHQWPFRRIVRGDSG